VFSSSAGFQVFMMNFLSIQIRTFATICGCYRCARSQTTFLAWQEACTSTLFESAQSEQFKVYTCLLSRNGCLLMFKRIWRSFTLAVRTSVPTTECRAERIQAKRIFAAGDVHLDVHFLPSIARNPKRCAPKRCAKEYPGWCAVDDDIEIQ
jgi:hypothetical protein